MPFPASSDLLPTAQQRFLELSQSESALPSAPARITLEELSKILDGFFSIAEKPTDDCQFFLIDPTGYFDIVKYSYEAVVEKGRASSLATCHELMLVSIWYLYRRLFDIWESVGAKPTTPTFFNQIGHDILPAPIWEYLSNLGPILLPTGVTAVPFLPPPSQDPFPGLLNDFPGLGLVSISGGTQLYLLRTFLENWEGVRRKDQSYVIGNVALGPQACSHVVKSWNFPNPSRHRILDEINHQWRGGTGERYCWNEAVLQSFRDLCLSTRSSYAYKGFEEIRTLHGSPSVMAIFERDFFDGVFHYEFRAPVSLSAKDVTLALLFRYRLIHTHRVNSVLGNAFDHCARFCPPDMSAPHGTRTSSRLEVLSQVKDFCSYYTVLR